MNSFLGFTKRNLLVYFKDKQAIIFSMLTPIILLSLYLLFLRQNYVDNINHDLKGLEAFITSTDVNLLVSALLLSGIIGSAVITVSFHTLSNLIDDREKKVDYDILSTPMKRVGIILSYFASAALTAFIMASVVLVFGLVALNCYGDLNFEAVDYLRAIGITLLGSLSATAFMMPIVLCFKTSSASGAFFGILSAVSGFVIGAYIPLSQFSTGVQTVCNLVPGCGVTILYRNALMNPILNRIDEAIGGVDEGAFVAEMRNTFSFKGNLAGHAVGQTGEVLYVLGFLALCIVLISVIYPRVYRKK